MKISLSWIADHINFDKKALNVIQLAEQLAATTAEIDGVECIRTDVSAFYAAVITELNEREIVVECPELKKKYILPLRKDAQNKQIYLIKTEGNEARWVMLTDIGSTKDGLLPSVVIPETEIKGAWRDSFEVEDAIIIIENKAITNRPDLWGHRGIAREVAALLQKNMVSEDFIYAVKPIKHYDHQSIAQGSNPFVLEIQQNDRSCGQPCNRLAGCYLSAIDYRPSLLWMAVRLARIDARPLDMLVDMTNYVMYDIGQPMHAFDAQKIETKKLVGRCAHEGEKLVLLDGEEVTLTSQDYVVSDGVKPLAVAGVMGGQSTAVSRNTQSLLLEAAHFDPSVIRRTATRLKKRTEASTRFEKSLDPNQNTQALLRYLKLLEDQNVVFEGGESIVSLGALAQDKIIEVTHDLIEHKIGMKITSERIESILTRIGFGVTKSSQLPLVYTVIVPTYRGTKDVTIPEDIVEEVARFVGYSSIIPSYPTRAMTAFDTTRIERMRALKITLAQGLALHEVHTYAFFDEEFLRVLNYDPTDALRIANPLSEHWQRLITSLVPNLLKCIAVNQTEETLRFFECNRVWFYLDHPVEEHECAGIWYEMKTPIDFYDGKSLLTNLFDFFKLDIRWEKPSKALDPWYDTNQTAELWYGDRIIGQAGKAAPLFLRTIAQGDAFIFELDANFLLNARKTSVFKPLHKYPSTDLDISLIVPIECTVFGLEVAIRAADSRITSVNLIDSFVRPEWTSKKSVTMRFTAYDPEGTLTKESIDTIWDHVVIKVKAIGAEVR